ncbi:TrmB family transcriptional regulator [Sulfolobus acidocaldarius SUSAZ]|nr:TrmB family transcriptional regulator [Sulfolobus acidocaldarius SUSAZ]
MSQEKMGLNKEVIRCCYKISDTDVDCLLKLIELRKSITSEELSDMMKVSKTTIENSLKKLMDIGLITREKKTDKRIGRPKYYYTLIINFEDKMRNDLLNCSKLIDQVISEDMARI